MTITVTVSPGGVLKREIVDMAFGELGISDYEPDEAVKALARLNALAKESPFDLCGYEQPTYGAGLLTDESGVDPAYLSAWATELALRIAPSVGKAASTELKRNAASARRTLPISIPSMSLARNTPRGSGARGTLTSPFVND